MISYFNIPLSLQIKFIFELRHVISNNVAF